MTQLLFSIVRFEARHALAIRLQEAQLRERAHIDEPETLRALEREDSFAFLDAQGAVLACAGLIDLPGWNGQRKFAWALLGERPGPAALLAITRAIRRYLDTCPARRIETSVDCNFPAGVIWASRLGFRCEGRMRGFGFDGADHFLFARAGR